MPDIVIGAGIGIGGVIIGGILTSFNSWIQMKHQEREAGKERRIKAREGYLIPLRQALSKYMNMSVRGAAAYGVLKELEEKGVKPEDRLESFKTMMDSMEDTSESIKEIELLSSQTADTILRELILDIKNQQIEMEPIVKQYSKWFAHITEIPPSDWNDLLRKYNSMVSSQLNRLIPINKRIEELLCGEKDA